MEPMTDVIGDLLVQQFGMFDSTITADTTFDSLEVDSLVLVELAVILERTYGVRIEDSELAAAGTVGAAAAVVTGKLATRQVPA